MIAGAPRRARGACRQPRRLRVVPMARSVNKNNGARATTRKLAEDSQRSGMMKRAARTSRPAKPTEAARSPHARMRPPRGATAVGTRAGGAALPITHRAATPPRATRQPYNSPLRRLYRTDIVACTENGTITHICCKSRRSITRPLRGAHDGVKSPNAASARARARDPIHRLPRNTRRHAAPRAIDDTTARGNNERANGARPRCVAIGAWWADRKRDWP